MLSSFETDAKYRHKEQAKTLSKWFAHQRNLNDL